MSDSQIRFLSHTATHSSKHATLVVVCHRLLLGHRLQVKVTNPNGETRRFATRPSTLSGD